MKTLSIFLLTGLILSACTDFKIAGEKIICEFPAPFEHATEDDQRPTVTNDSSHKQVEKDPPPSREEVLVSPNDYDQIAELVPSGWTIVQNQVGKEIVEADFNQDSLMDVALLVEIRGDTTYDFSEDVMLIVALQEKNGQLETVSISGNLGGESISYSTQKHLWTKDSVLSYWHQSMRHHVIGRICMNNFKL